MARRRISRAAAKSIPVFQSNSDPNRNLAVIDECKPAVPGLALGARLTRKVEYDLIRKAQAGDIGARNALVEHHMPFICNMVCKCIPPWVNVNEWISYGVEGFIAGIMGFRLDSKNKLVTYAGTAIERRVWKAYPRRGVISVPARTPHLQDGTYQTNRERAMKCRSIDAVFIRNGRERTIKDALAAKTESEDNRAQQTHIQILALRACIDKLGRIDHRLPYVMRMRMKGMTLEDVGNAMQLTKERVRQLQYKGLCALRVLMGVEVEAAA